MRTFWERTHKLWENIGFGTIGGAGWYMGEHLMRHFFP